MNITTIKHHPTVSATRRRLSRTALRRVLVNARYRTVTPSDVMLASYPKSGNTWMRHILTELMTGEISEWRGALHEVVPGLGSHDNAVRSLRDGGRLIKTHERPHPRVRQAILMTRDGRDVALSEFHYRKDYLRSPEAQHIDFGTHLDRFLAGSTNAYGTWRDHCTAWLAWGTEPGNRLLAVRYEDIKGEPERLVHEITDFLQIDVTEEAIRCAVENNSIGAMKHRERVVVGDDQSPFVRQGRAGGWQEQFDDAARERFEKHAGSLLDRLRYEDHSA